MDQLTRYFLRHYTLVLDNDQYTHNRANGIARDVVANEMPSMQQYQDMSTSERESNYANEIGEQILEWINELIDETLAGAPESAGATLLLEIRPDWSDLAYELGAHYMPETGDMEGLLEDEEGDGV